MKKAIQFGAGNIGRGFIGTLLAQAGYEVVFADVSLPIIEKLNEDGGYTVHILDSVCEEIEIKNVRAINSSKETAIEELATAEIITTAVGPVILSRIAPTIAKAIETKFKDDNTTVLHIIACENAVRASSALKKSVYEALDQDTKAFAEKYVGFVDCAVDRIVPPVKMEKFTDVVVERYFEWDVDRNGFIGEIPTIEGMTVVDNLDAYVERKLFTLNTGHAITAYLGCLKGYSTIAEAINDKDILRIVKSAMGESGQGLVKKYALDETAHKAYIEKIITRFCNPHLQDDVTRVGREPLRKLSATDRLIKPMVTAHNYKLPVTHLLVGVAAALHYNNAEDGQSVELQTVVKEKGLREAVKTFTGIENKNILDTIEKLYKAIENSSDFIDLP
ncbi:MAG: mannitol-1-phosphate 5-dehydrogenase [Anaerotignaceae bacterium]